MLNNYADSGGGFNSNHGQTARPTETQKQQNIGAPWGPYNSQLEGLYYGSEHQPMYMGSYDGSAKHTSYPQYPSGTIHQPVPTPVQCYDTCCPHYENRYPINPAALRYQPSGPLQPRYSDIPNSESRQYFPDRRPVQVNLPRKKVYPAENGYAGISDSHYPQYMGRGQALPVDSRQQMQVIRPQYTGVYPPYWGSSRGWAGARMNCPPPSYHQSVNQSAQLQPGTKITDNSQYMDPMQKSLSAQHQRGVSSSSGKLDIIRPVPEPKRPTLDSNLQSCYEYGYPTGFLPFSEVSKIQGKSLNPQSMNVPCKVPAEKQYRSQQMQYSYQNNERNLINYGNPSNDPSYTMNYPLSSNDIHARPDLEEGQQASGARKLSMHYDSSGKKRQDLNLRQYLETWEDDEDESARLSEPPLPVGSTATPYIVVECSSLESDAAAKLQERFKPLPPSQEYSTKPRGCSPNSEHKRSNEQPRQEERTERTIIHSDLHSQTSYAPSMPTLLSDSDKNVNFWNGINKESESVIGKGGAFQPLDCSKRDSNVNPKVVSQRDALPPRDITAHKVLCSSDPNSSFDALVSYYGDNRRVSGDYDLVEMSERLINSSDKARIDYQPSTELAKPCDPRLQQSQQSNNPSMYDKLSPRFSTNNYDHLKSVSTDPYYNYKHPMSSSEKYYSYENSPIINSNYDYNKFVSEFDNTRLYGNKEAPKDPRRVLHADSLKNPENSIIEPISASSMSNCFKDKASLEYTSLEPDQFMSPIVVKSTDNQSELCSQKSIAIEDRLNKQQTKFSNILSSGTESQVQSEKTVLVTSQSGPAEIFNVLYSKKKEMAHKDNVVTLHSGDQTKNNTMTVEVPYVQQYSSLVKLSEEISRTEGVDENKRRALALTQEDKTAIEEIKKPTCFKLKRLPNSKEWAVEGNKSTESGEKEGMSSPKSPETIEDSDILKTSVSVSNLNMPSLDDIRDGEENCEVNLENHSRPKVSEGVLCPNKTSVQPPQLAIVQPMKLVPCEEESQEPNLQNELNNEDNNTKHALKAFRSFHEHNLNGASFSSDKPVTDCDSQIDGIKTDISKHENFRSHKKIQGNFSDSFPNCLSSPNEGFSHSQGINSETNKQQYSPFHMYADCEVNSQIPDFFKMDQRSSSNEKMLDKQRPTSPGVEGMFEDINHSTNNQLCHNQIYQRKSCNFQDLTGPSMSSFDNHNSHFQSFSHIFADDSNNKGRCDGSVLHMGDKKYLKHLLDDIEREQVSNTLEERVSKLKSNFMNETSNDKACEAKKSPPIPPINLKLNESKKVWCITNKDQHLSLSDFSENGSLSLPSKSSTTENGIPLTDNKSEKENLLMEISPEETNQSCCRNEDILLSPDKNFNNINSCDKMEIEPTLNRLSSETIDKECSSSDHIPIIIDIDRTSAEIPMISSVDPTKNSFSESISQSTTDLNDTTSKKENRCLSIVKYYSRYEILKGKFLYNIDSSTSPNILILDEKGTHFPTESNGEDSHNLEVKSIAKDIVDLLITNVIFSRKMIDCLGDKPVSVAQDKLTEQERACSKWEENIETVIKFDKSSSSSKNVNEQKHITKTTQIFIEREKEHNQHSSVIKAIQSEKYFSSVDERKICRSIFSPMPDDSKDNNPISSHSSPSVTSYLTEEKSTLNFDFTEVEDNSDKMDIDVTENSDDNQPLDYSLGDLTTHKRSSSLDRATSENVVSSDSSVNSVNINEKEFKEKELGNSNCCLGGLDVSNNTSHITENNNSKSFSIKQITNSSCSKNDTLHTVLVCEHGEMAKESKNNYQSASFNSENSIVDDSFSSDKSDFESDFDISDSEPTKEKETLAKESIDFMDLSNEKSDSNCILIKEPLLTACSNKEKESTQTIVNKSQEIKGQSHILKVDELSHDELNASAIFAKDNLVHKSVELNSESTNKEENLTTTELISMNTYFKDTNTNSNKSNCSLENKSENPSNDCPLKSSQKKFEESPRVTSPVNCHVNGGSNTKFHKDERSETSVIVRNNSFTTINNNHREESSSNLCNKIESNVQNKCDFSTSKSKRVNQEIPDLPPQNYKPSLLADIKENTCEDDVSNHIYNNISEECMLITKVINYESNISDEADGDESMETESCSIVETPVIPITECSSLNTVETKSLEEGVNSKLSYCVSESIFLNIDKESLLCLDKSIISYLFDFKRRKLLKFHKSVIEPQLSFIENITKYNRDSSTVHFGMNQQAFPSSVVICDKSYPMSEKSHYSNAQIDSNYKFQGSADEVNSAPLSQYNKNITDSFKSHFDPPETFNPLCTVNKNQKPPVAELNGNHSEEDSAVLKPSKHMVLLKSKLCFSQEINSFCVRRDSLKILEPEAVLKEIFSPDPDFEDRESKENYSSANNSKDKLKISNNTEKFSLAPITCSNVSTPCNDPSAGNKWNSINSSTQNIAHANCNLLNSDKDKPLVLTNSSICNSDVNSEICDKGQSKPTDEKDESKSLSNCLKTSKSFKHNICKEQFPFIGAEMLNEKSPLEDQLCPIASSIEDCNSLDISCKSLSKNSSESSRYFTESLTHSDQISLLYSTKSLEYCDQASVSTKLNNKNYYEEECCESKITNTEHLPQEDQITTESSTGSVPQNMQTLSCQISNLDNQVNHINDSEKSISSMSILTGRDVLFSSRFHEDDEDKELNSELQTENRSRKSSVEEESSLDCQNMKVNSQDSLRGGGHLSSETFPLQYLVEAALAVENVDSKQMLLNSSSFSGIYSQSSQSLIKSTIGDVHPNDIEDLPEKNTFSSSNSDPNICQKNKLSAVNQEIFSKFEENNYNLRASTRIVTSSSSNIIPYSKRYYRLKSQKLPKPHSEKINKSETSIKKSQSKKRKDVFTYPRSKRRKKGMKEKPKYLQLKKQLDFCKKMPGNKYNQISYTDDSTQNCENKLVFEEPHSSSNNQRKEKEDCFQSHNTNRSAENYNLGAHQSLSGKSNFGGPLIIASENSPVESNIFCVHVNSDKMDEYVHDLNVGGLELLSEHNQSVFKDNSIEEQSETPDVTMENGTSLVIIIEELEENREKDNYYNTCKDGSDVILGSMEERSPLPQPNSILDYCSDNLTSEVSINESCICPSNFDNERNSAHSLFKDSISQESECSMTYKSYGINSGKFDKYSSECNQELLTTNCYEEINETLVNDIGNWPFVEEEVAEFNTKSVSPNRIPEEGRKIELKCSLPWNKIFNMDKTKKKKNKMSHKVSGLELGPAKVEVRLRAPSTEWKVISDYAENSSPVVKVSRLILQRESEASSYSEKDSEEENENRKLLSPLYVNSELKDNSNSNDVSVNLIEDESWQPVVLLTRDKELDELTRSRAIHKELDQVVQSKSGDKELVEFALTLDSPLHSEQSTFTGFSSQDNEDMTKDDSESESSEIVGDENRVDLSEQSKSSGSLQTNFENMETDLFENLSEKRNVYAKYQYAKVEKGCTYETYSPSRHDGSHADETIYSPSDPHYSPEPGYLYSDSSSFGDKKKSDVASESNTSPIENHYNSLHQANFGSFNTFNKDTINKENYLHRTGCARSKSYLFSGSPENVNFQDSETSDTNYSSETQNSSLYDGGRNNLAETNSLSHGEVHQVNNQYVRPDLLDTPNIILSNETRKSDLRKSETEENLRKFKRKMPKNFFVRRKSRKNVELKIDATENILLERKCDQDKPIVSSSLTDDKSFPCSTEFALRQRRSPNSSDMDSTPNEWQTVQSSALTEERLNNTTSDLSFVCENSRLPCLDDLKDSFPMRLNDSPVAERFEEKLRLRDGGRGLKRPCEGHSKEDTKRRRRSLSNHSNKCQECGVQFETKVCNSSVFTRIS